MTAQSAVPHFPRRGATLWLVLAVALLLGACSSPTSLDPIETDPGIAASVRVVEGKTDALFAELERNMAAPFSEYDAIHYRPLLDELANAQRLARVHDRPAAEREALDALQASYDQMRRQHREQKLGFSDVQAFRARLATQIEAILRMERR